MGSGGEVGSGRFIHAVHLLVLPFIPHRNARTSRPPPPLILKVTTVNHLMLGVFSLLRVSVLQEETQMLELSSFDTREKRGRKRGRKGGKKHGKK
jgi:hypothetical protein